MNAEVLRLDSFPAAAEYLTNIYLLQRDYGKASNLRLSQWMKVSTSAVTQAVGRLKKLGLVEQERYGDMVLTTLGRETATRVLKQHYLLEHLLVDILGYPWDKADEEAHILQNHISAELTQHLDIRLGFPQTCPHGNPLPGVPVEQELLQAPRLNQAQQGDQITVLRISEEGEAIADMLPFCQSRGIKPGAGFAILAADRAGLTLQSLTAVPATTFDIPQSLSHHICVRFQGR